MKHLGKFEGDDDLITKGALDGKADKIHNHTISDIDNLQTELNKCATKDDLASIDISNQLQDYAKKDWVIDNLSETAEGMNKRVGDLFSNFNDFTEIMTAKIEGRAPKEHTHAITDIKGLQNELDGKATKDDLAKVDVSSQLEKYAIDSEMRTIIGNVKNNLEVDINKKANAEHTHNIPDINNLQTKLDGKADKDHTHKEYLRNVGINDDGFIAFNMNGNWYTTDARTPYRKQVAFKDHRHDISDINNLQSKLDLFTSGLQDTMGRLIKKADENHTHEIEDVIGLKDKLNSKASSTHTHTDLVKEVGIDSEGEIIYLQGNTWRRTSVNAYKRKLAFKNHTHDIADINNLQTALNNKANSSHTHSEYLKKGDPIILTSQQKAELKGDRGATGANGTSVSISSTLKNTTKRVTVVTFSNGTVIEIPWGENGKNGAQGWRGDPGKDGSSITTWVGTQSQYNSIGSKSSTTLYLIKG